MSGELFNSKSPLISVLMTAFNRANYIADAISSVLASTFTDFELIIVDDNSSDETVEIARRFEQKDNRVKVFVNDKNLGDYPNRNRAASLAAGKYIKYLDSDDIMYPYCLEVMAYCMEKFPEAGYGLSAAGDYTQPFPVCVSERKAYVQYFNGMSHFGRAPGSAIIKKSAFDKVNGFSGMRQVGDFEFWLKIGSYFPLVKMPADLYWSRSHEDRESKAHNNMEKQKLRMEVLKRTFREERVPLSEAEKLKVIASFSSNIFTRMLRRLSGVQPAPVLVD